MVRHGSWIPGERKFRDPPGGANGGRLDHAACCPPQVKLPFRVGLPDCVVRLIAGRVGKRACSPISARRAMARCRRDVGRLPMARADTGRDASAASCRCGQEFAATGGSDCGAGDTQVPPVAAEPRTRLGSDCAGGASLLEAMPRARSPASRLCIQARDCRMGTMSSRRRITVVERRLASPLWFITW